MKRVIWVSLGWCVVGGGLYLSVLLLDLHWNLFTWAPQWDAISAGLVCGVAGVVGLAWFVARRTCGGVSLGLAALVSVFLAGAALYASKAEPIQMEGMLPRKSSSPVWYRGSRVILMSLPGALLFWRWRCKTKAAPGAKQPEAAE